MSYIAKNDREREINDMIVNSYGKTIRSIEPINLNWLNLARSIGRRMSSGTSITFNNLFFGTLVFNEAAYLPKILPAISASYVGTEFYILCTYLFGNSQQVLNNASSKVSSIVVPSQASNSPTIYTDILFDDIQILSRVSQASTNYGELTSINFNSISSFVPGSNNTASNIATIFAANLAANPNFIWAPNALFFTGYKIVLQS